jgi:hypothetical protein
MSDPDALGNAYRDLVAAAGTFSRLAVVGFKQDAPAAFKAFNAAFSAGLCSLQIEVTLDASGEAAAVRVVAVTQDGRRQTLSLT